MSVGSGQKPPVIFLMGPTATGKTDVAAALCDHLPVELISVDSTLVYHGLDIGTAKPDAALLARAPHHLIDIRDPADPYSAADFARDVLPLLESITMAGRIPLLVGGTMLYFRVLLEGLGDLPPSDPSVREEILAQAEMLGWPALHKELMTVDPETASALHPNHSQRIQRALEIYRLTGLPPSRIKRQTEGGIQPIRNKYEVIQLALTPQHRQLLHRRIAERFQRMLEQGFVDEVKGLRTRPDLHPDLPAIRAVGYRQVWDHLAGNDDYQTMVNKGVAATRQLAKRQLTWLRRWPSLTEVSIDTEQGKAKSLEEIVSNCLKILQNGPIY